MPPVIPGRAARQVQALARPANQARATAQQQQGGSSGTIPGTASDPTQVGHTTGIIPLNPPTGPSPNGDQVAGVGIQVLNNADPPTPVVVMGNLAATQTSGTDLPANFTDGGFAFVDDGGNLVAGYSQETGLWGFAPPAAGGPSMLTAWMDWVTGAGMNVLMPDGEQVAGYGITVPATAPTHGLGLLYNACVTQVGSYAGGSIGFWGNCLDDAAWTSESAVAIVSAYTLDGASSIQLWTGNYSAADANNSHQFTAWDVLAVTGTLLSAPGDELVVAGPCMLAVNYLLKGNVGD
jgi:hypothetical protein